LRHYGVGKVVDRTDHADAAHHGGLSADIDGVAADMATNSLPRRLST
jgi:hypothetical protein